MGPAPMPRGPAPSYGFLPPAHAAPTPPPVISAPSVTHARTSLSLSLSLSCLFPRPPFLERHPTPFHPFISHSSIHVRCHATLAHPYISAIHRYKCVPSFDSLYDEMDDMWNFNPSYTNCVIINFIMIAPLEGHECVSPAGGTLRSYHHEAFTRRMRGPPDGTYQLTSRLATCAPGRDGPQPNGKASPSHKANSVAVAAA